MSLTTKTPPRAFAVWFKDLRLWSVGSFARLQWQWPNEYVRPLSEALCRRVEEVDRKQHAVKDLQLVTLHFDGSMEPRGLDGQKSFKGKLFFALPNDVVYSRIDVRNGAIGIVPPEMPKVAVSGEYPVYKVSPQVALPAYVKLLFRTDYFRRTINSMISGASGRKRVQPEQLEEMKVPLPPLNIQNEIIRGTKKRRSKITEERKKAHSFSIAVKQEIEEMILGVRPVPETSESRKLSA